MTRLGSATSLPVGGLLAAALLALLPAMGLPGSSLLVPLSKEGRNRLWTGAHAPSFALPGSVDSTLESRISQRPLVLLLTETCPFCRQLAGQLRAPAKATAASRLLTVIAASARRPTATSLLALPAGYLVARDTTGVVFSRYRVDAVPALYALDVQGRVRRAAFGLRGCSRLLQRELPHALRLEPLDDGHHDLKGG